MTDNNLRVLALTRYTRLGGSSRLRFYDFQAALKEHGIYITPAPFFDDEYLERLYAKQYQPMGKIFFYYARRFKALMSAGKYDLVWLEKEALPWLPAWLETKLLRKPYVIDFDDAWFHRYDMHANPLVRSLLQNKFSELVRKSAAVLAGSPYLADWAEKQGAHKVERLPTTVNLDRYSVKAPETNQDFVIGWMGSPSTATYLHKMRKTLLHVFDDSNTKLKLIGSGNTGIFSVHDEPWPPWPNDKSRVVPWTETNEVADLISFDVGIMPLTSDPWSEGKCAYKLIQYMAVGLPVVASPVGMNRDVVQHGVNGFLADSDQEWIAALKALRDDPGLRRRMGLAGRKIVEERYALTGNTGLLAQTLRDAATKDVPR